MVSFILNKSENIATHMRQRRDDFLYAPSTVRWKRKRFHYENPSDVSGRTTPEEPIIILNLCLKILERYREVIVFCTNESEKQAFFKFLWFWRAFSAKSSKDAEDEAL